MKPYVFVVHIGIYCTFCLASSLSATAEFIFLDHNQKWYRTYDSTSTIGITKGELLFSWKLTDSDQVPDSFYIGIDTLWMLPQDVNGDTTNDWDLQVCPDGFCILGLKAKVFGGNAPYAFEGFNFTGEHHFQFIAAYDQNFRNTAPSRTIFAGLMFARSRTTGTADTVFAFGAWNMVWDDTFPPPKKPVNGYIPRLSDFEITGDTVRYKKGGSSPIIEIKSVLLPEAISVSPSPFQNQLTITFNNVTTKKEVLVYDFSGSLVWSSGKQDAFVSSILWNGRNLIGTSVPQGIYFVNVRTVSINYTIRIVKIQ